MNYWLSTVATEGIESKLDGIELKLGMAIAKQLNQNASVSEKLFQIVAAYDILQKSDPPSSWLFS